MAFGIDGMLETCGVGLRKLPMDFPKSVLEIPDLKPTKFSLHESRRASDCNSRQSL